MGDFSWKKKPGMQDWNLESVKGKARDGRDDLRKNVGKKRGL